KGSLYEGGIREPAIMSYPGTIGAGQTIDTPCAMFDVFPSAFEVAGLPLPDHQIDGTSVLGLVTGKDETPHEKLFWEYGPNQLAVREGNWKLVLNGREDGIDGVEEAHLVDLSTDPGEKKNLADQEPDVLARLTKEVQQWDVEIGGHN
ncbi:MAG: sulfatase/phosphatase domain-containing protein, partial [Candidatus Latescibacterota bacterium]|nr:sulfatase/phosphatase domain-containing protein [Candidatus Latescibacterota bacterium]